MVAGQGATLIGAAVKRKEDPRLLTGGLLCDGRTGAAIHALDQLIDW